MAKRVIVGLLLGLVVLAMLYLGNTAEAIVFTLGAILAVHELGQAIKKNGYSPFMAPAYVFAALYAFLAYRLTLMSLAMLWMACVLAVIVERILNRQRKTEETFLSLGVFAYPLPLFAVLFLLAVSFGRARGVSALLLAFACPLAGDSFAFFIGTYFGKHKLCPEISPKKTVEGSVASVFGSVAGAVVVYFLQPLWGVFLPLWPMLLLGLACGFLGQVGDLFASVIKRWANIKDFGSIFPGHGGMMDRVDSVLLCAPAVYLCFYLL
ncbi:MAG TPA: phosphatidate cytidylyltransferase [Feifaniaceae bacterium]|nr:phosphatidate cytidylyltransferase [Feifaniaceae bacterium]